MQMQMIDCEKLAPLLTREHNSGPMLGSDNDRRLQLLLLLVLSQNQDSGQTRNNAEGWLERPSESQI